jgi:hypothetical protein
MLPVRRMANQAMMETNTDAISMPQRTIQWGIVMIGLPITRHRATFKGALRSS